jgi:hypothetical protein
MNQDLTGLINHKRVEWNTMSKFRRKHAGARQHAECAKDNLSISNTLECILWKEGFRPNNILG